MLWSEATSRRLRSVFGKNGNRSSRGASGVIHGFFTAVWAREHRQAAVDWVVGELASVCSGQRRCVRGSAAHVTGRVLQPLTEYPVEDDGLFEAREMRRIRYKRIAGIGQDFG